MRKHGMIFILCLLLTLLCPFIVLAEEYTSEKHGLDIMFVMDYSGSMKTNDSHDLSRVMVKAFVDTVYSTDVRVGFVAYNDRILTSTSPFAIQTTEERTAFKRLLDQDGYSGNTDIGLGLSYGLKLLEEKSERKQVIVLISDGESDLAGSTTGRTTEDSVADMEKTAEECAGAGIQIYTVAFGTYDGNTDALRKISEDTSAEMYTAETPERLIEILYGIFGTNMDYSIREVTDSVFAPGIQNIRVGLREDYLDEIDVLLISSQKIGNVSVLYDGQEIETVNLGNYAVGKITNINNTVRELTVQAETLQNQELQLYLVSYRSLIPVLEIDPLLYKNGILRYTLYFRDKNGNQVSDGELYHNFKYEFSLDRGQEEDGSVIIPDVSFSDGQILGEASIKESGTWFLQASLEDSMGSSTFEPIQIMVKNRAPEGGLPEQERITILTGDIAYSLDEYFFDPDGDELFYTLETGTGEILETALEDDVLNIRPQKAGTQELFLKVSDGESTLTYEDEIEVIPLWKAYWWGIVIFIGVIGGIIIWKLTHKPKPELEQLEEKTKENHFCGKLDAYFTVQPETEEEIPPLSFQLYKVKDNKLTLGNLLEEYPKIVELLELNSIYLVADVDRNIILYHMSGSSVMIGNSIACKQIQYSVSFGDVIYITSLDGSYELEIHYIAVIQ